MKHFPGPIPASVPATAGASGLSGFSVASTITRRSWPVRRLLGALINAGGALALLWRAW